MPAIQRFIADAALPARASVVVIGGGIIGVMTALELAGRGVDVLLCEKGEIAAEQSSRNWGWVRVMGRDAAEIPLSQVSLAMWAEMDARYGIDTGFRQTGITYLCETEGQVDAYRNWLADASQYGVRSVVLSPAEIAARLPGAARHWAGALHTPTDGYAEPFRAVPEMAETARRLGVRIVTGTAVRSLDVAGGRIVGVFTEHGRVACDQVVVAGGAWSRHFLRNAGIGFPQLKILNSVQRTSAADSPIAAPLGTPAFGIRRRDDGGYTIAERNTSLAHITLEHFALLPDYLGTVFKNWKEYQLRFGRPFFEELAWRRRWQPEDVTVFEKIRVLDPAPDARGLARGRAAVSRDFPMLASAGAAEQWAGYIDVTPDAVPVIGPVPALGGLFLASGFSGHGFGIGPGAGRLMADLVTGATPVVDPYRFRLDRFRSTRR